jgi:recombination protein RecT
MHSTSNTAIQTQSRKPKFSEAMATPIYKNLVASTLGDAEVARRFTASIMSAVAQTPALQECTPATILTGALVGESLKLSPSPQLGQFYLVPFKSKEKRDKNGNVIEEACTKAQFIIGYKGYVQLALRSGQYRKLNVIEIRQGELISYDPLNEDISVCMVEDFEAREKLPVIGYYAMFEYTNGFRKAVYWTKKHMMKHADQYSAAFSAKAYEDIQAGKIPDSDMWKYSSFWYKDFDDMAKKTLLRHIISRWGIMSIDLQTAIERDETMMDIDRKGNIVTEAEKALEGELIDSLNPVMNGETAAVVFEDVK